MFLDRPRSYWASSDSRAPRDEETSRSFVCSQQNFATHPVFIPDDENPSGHQKTLKTVWQTTLRRAKIAYFRISDLPTRPASVLAASPMSG
jgi:hypothetical protein